jgi:hypothetical protein
VKSSILSKELGVCNRVCTEDERYISNSQSGMQLKQRCCFCDEGRRPMIHGTKAQNNQQREDNASVQDMDWMRRGRVSLQLQDLLHQKHTSTMESLTGLVSRIGIGKEQMQYS